MIKTKPDNLEWKILEAAERELRRVGVQKLRVVDVARICGITHAHVYNFYPDRLSLLKAITKKWFLEMEHELQRNIDRMQSAAAKLEAYMIAMNRIKKRILREDPQIFTLFFQIGDEYQDVVDMHLKTLRGYIAAILADSEFRQDSKEASVQLVWNVSLAFHYPMLVQARLEDDQTAEIRLAARALYDFLRRK